jgi:nucleoside-diphosphate-sugar epimerase
VSLKVVILGANGLIGSALTAAILERRDWGVYGMDLANRKLRILPSSSRFHFAEGDISIHREGVVGASPGGAS